MLTHILKINWCCLQFEGKLKVTEWEGWGRGRSSVGPLVVVELRGVVLAVAALHGDTAGQDGGHVVPEVVPLLLLPLGLHLPQIEPWKWKRSEWERPRPSFQMQQRQRQCAILLDFKEETVTSSGCTLKLHPLRLSRPLLSSPVTCALLEIWLSKVTGSKNPHLWILDLYIHI